jgi:hypothetical protein
MGCLHRVGQPQGVALLKGLKRFYGPSIEVNLQDNLEFGIVCRHREFLTLRVYNVGTRDLMILSVTSSGSGDFTVLPAPALPLAIAPGAQIDFTIGFAPTVRGVPETATIQIISNDPVTPSLDVSATGFGGTGALETIIADSGNFGSQCVGSFVDRDLTLNNRGPCRLSIENVTSSSPEFLAPSVSSYPLTVAPGASIALPIRFQPTSSGSKTSTLTVFSDDPASPKSVEVWGNSGTGKLAVTGSAFFGCVPACTSPNGPSRSATLATADSTSRVLHSVTPIDTGSSSTIRSPLHCVPALVWKSSCAIARAKNSPSPATWSSPAMIPLSR